MRKRTSFGVALAFLLLFSIVLVFEAKLPEANAALFSDDFANVNNWSVINGVWTSADSVLQGTSTVGGQGLIWAGNTAWTNYKVTANVRLVNSGETSLVVRYKGPTDFYWLGLGCWGHKFSISKVVNGVYQELASSGLASEVEVGRWYLVSAVALDGTLQLFVDGINVLQIQDNSLSKGAIGFRDWGDTMQAEYLNVQSITLEKTFGGTGNDEGRSIVQSSDGGLVIAGSTGGDVSKLGTDVYLFKTDSLGNMLWSKTYGGTNSDSGYSVIQTSDGGYAIAGTSYSFGAGNGDVYLVKTDSLGNMLWSKTYGGTNSDSGYSVIQTSDGGYAIAGTSYSFGAGNGDVYLVKTDSLGNMLWSKTYGGTNSYDIGYSIVQTSDGGYAIIGQTTDINSDGHGSIYFVKTDASGNMQWSKTYGLGCGNSVVQTSDGGYAIAGTIYFTSRTYYGYLVKTDSSGNVLWDLRYGNAPYFNYYTGGNSIVQTTDGGYTIAGYTNSMGAGGYDIYLAKVDSAGHALWQKTYGGTSYDYGYSVVQTSDSGFAIAGLTGSGGGDLSYDVVLVKIPSDDPPFTVDNYDRSWHNSSFTITLTAIDDEFTTVSNTNYRINDGSSNSVTNNGQPVINTDGANNKLEYWSVDSLGNVEIHHILTGIKLDKTAPTGSIIINGGGAFTTSTAVTLTLTSNDQTSGVSLVRYSNDGVWDTEGWESATSSKSWTLTSGDGAKTVYYQVKDNAGLLSSSYSDTIILETSPTPTPTPTPTATPTPPPTSTPTPTQTPSPTQTPTATPTPTPTPSPTPTASPTPSPSPSPTPPPSTPPTNTPMLNSTPTASPTPNPTPTPTPNPTETPTSVTPTLSTSQIPSPSPAPLSQPAATPLYLYAVAVISISAISATTVLIIKKRR